jgi:outer membrane protein assembly factor BamB
MLPSVIKVGKEGEALPMNANGKLDRQRLAHPSWGMAAALPPLVPWPQREGEEEEATTNIDTKLEEMESWLDRRFTALLGGGGQEGRGLGFFERGGHSLVAMQALSEIGLHFGVVGLNVEDLALMLSQLARRIWRAVLEEKATAAATATAPATAPATERPSKRTRTTTTTDDEDDGGGSAAVELVELVEQWKFSFSKCVDAPPLVVEVAPGEFWVVIGSHDHTIAAIDLETGDMKWRTRVEGRVEGAAAVQGGLVFVGCYDHRLYALELQTGSIAWSCLTGGEIKCTPLPVSLPFSSSSSLVVFGSYDGHLYMCETEKKGQLWTAPVALGGSLFASPIVLAGAKEEENSKAFVFTVTNRGRVALWSLQETDEAGGGGGEGEGRREVMEEWRYEMQCAVFTTPAVVVLPGGGGQRIILGGVDGSVVALDPWERCENPAAVVPLWRAVLDGPIFASPCLLPSKGQVLVACHGHGQGALYCLDMETGAREWKQQEGVEEQNDDQAPASSFISGKPALLLGKKGRFVIVGTSQGVVKVLDVERKGQVVGGGSLRLGKNHQRLSAPVVVGVGRGEEARHLAVFGSREDGVFCVQVTV